MARKTITVTEYTDDLDGKALTEDEIVSITFAWDGKTRRIDLSSAHADQFAKAMSKWVEASAVVTEPATSGRRATRAASASPSASTARRDPEQSKAIREWARSNGWPNLGDRGRIPSEVEEAYNSANG